MLMPSKSPNFKLDDISQITWLAPLAHQQHQQVHLCHPHAKLASFLKLMSNTHITPWQSFPKIRSLFLHKDGISTSGTNSMTKKRVCGRKNCVCGTFIDGVLCSRVKQSPNLASRYFENVCTNNQMCS